MTLPEGQQHPLGTSYLYGTLQQSDSGSVQGTYAPYLQGSSAMGVPAIQPHNTNSQRDTIFPERPGQPECQYYMKTGDCKFGITCRYHHPKDRAIPSPTCILSPMGLPLRPVRNLSNLSTFIVHVKWCYILHNWRSFPCFLNNYSTKRHYVFGCMGYFSYPLGTHSALSDPLNDRVHHLAASTTIMVFANLARHANLIIRYWA
jgi:hypothetical protein